MANTITNPVHFTGRNTPEIQELVNMADISDTQLNRVLGDFAKIEKTINVPENNQAPTIVAKSNDLTGTITVPGFEKCFEVFSFTFGAYHKDLDMGPLRTNAHVNLKNLLLVVPDSQTVVNAMDLCIKGKMIEELHLATLVNVGEKAMVKPQIELFLTYPRITLVSSFEDYTLISLSYTAIKRFSYNQWDDNAVDKGRVAMEYDAKRNTAGA